MVVVVLKLVGEVSNKGTLGRALLFLSPQASARRREEARGREAEVPPLIIVLV
jgi:hypothetical protein